MKAGTLPGVYTAREMLPGGMEYPTGERRVRGPSPRKISKICLPKYAILTLFTQYLRTMKLGDVFKMLCIS